MKLRKSRAVTVVVISVLLGVSALFNATSATAQAAYQSHINWAANDNGGPDCPQYYLALPGLAWCLAAGNRSCATGVAIEAAYRHYDIAALYIMAEITQCHNQGARNDLYNAGATAVGDELRRYNRPVWGPALDIAAVIAQSGD